jgi:uncharacterized protein
MIQITLQRLTAFTGHRQLASGPPAEVALAVLKAFRGADGEPIVIFDDGNGKQIDLDLRGGEQDIVARLHDHIVRLAFGALAPVDPTEATR